MGVLSAIWLILLFLGTRVSIVLIAVSCLYFVLNDIPGFAVAQRLYAGLDSFVLLAIPLFVLMAAIMNRSGVAERIFDFAFSLVGHVRGGAGHVNVLASLFFSGMSGAALADAAGLGPLQVNAMRKEGYPDWFSGGISAASCILGPLVPPSIPLVLYGMLANESVGRLFLAGILPGLGTALLLMCFVYALSIRHNFPRTQRPDIKHVFRSGQSAFLPLLTPVIVIAGIFTGIFTPTEAAAVAVLWATFLGSVVYRTLSLASLLSAVKETATSTAVIGFVISAASLFGWVVTREQVPQAISDILLSLTDNPILILLMINILLLVLGMFIESTAILIVAVPMLLPVVAHAGIDTTQFGVIVVLNLMIGLLTPPFGMALFVISQTCAIPLRQVLVGTAVFIGPTVLMLLLLVIFPSVSLFIPDLAK